MTREGWEERLGEESVGEVEKEEGEDDEKRQGYRAGERKGGGFLPFPSPEKVDHIGSSAAIMGRR